MIELTQGDILRADADAIVNTVNCVGFMGRGIAAQFKRAYPENFRVYETACKRGDVQPGRMLMFQISETSTPRWIVNFPTKRHWRADSRIEDIKSGLVALIGEVRQRSIRSIAVPPLGCGLGGLEWDNVKPLIVEAFTQVPDVRVLLYEPAGAPASETMVRAKEAPKMTPGRAALVGLVRRYMSGLMDPFVSLLEVHKLMYFAQEVMSDETFGPVIPIQRVASLDEAVRLANDTTFGLGSSVWAGDLAVARKLGERIRAGMTSVNSVMGFAGIPSLPFGGVGDSGFGRIHGDEGIREFTRIKSTAEQAFSLPINMMSFRQPKDMTKRVKGMIKTLYGEGVVAKAGDFLRKLRS